MAKAHWSSFGQKVSYICRIFPWIDAPDPVITTCCAILLLIPVSAPQVPGQSHMKLLFYATEPWPALTWQISIIFLSSADPQVTNCTACFVSEFAMHSQRFGFSQSLNILCQKDDNHQKRRRDWGEKGQGDLQTKKCVWDKVSDKETAKAVK